MTLNKYKLGSLMIPYSQKCGIPNLTPEQVSGVNKDKEFFEPSHQVGEDTSKYQIVPPRHFACNLMHVGRDRVLPIAYNHSEHEKVVSPAYTVFSLKESCGVLDDYFFIMLKCEEQDRYFWFHADASVRDGMSWSDFCDVEITVPDIPTQQKYVDIYKAMVANQQSYERGLDNLKTVFTAYIEKLKHAYPLQSFSPLITERQEINKNATYSNLVGVGNEGFITPRGARDKDTFFKCNIFYYKDFVYNPSVVSKGAIALNLDVKVPQICTEEYIVFYVNDETVLLPEYLFIWLKRE